jgi:hypothetical protein
MGKIRESEGNGGLGAIVISTETPPSSGLRETVVCRHRMTRRSGEPVLE